MLEQVLADLVLAIKENTAALKSAAVTSATVTVSSSDTSAPAVIEEPKKRGPKPKTETPAAAVPAPAPAPAPAPTPEPAAVVYPTVAEVRAAAQALLDANENKDGGLFASINTTYGTKKISEVAETVRAEVIAKIKAKTAEIVAAKSNSAASAV